MGFRDRVKRLERKAEGNRTELVCPACGWETTVRGDVWSELIVLDWEDQGSPAPLEEPSAFSAHPSVVELFNHKHPADEFIEKKSGLNLYHPTVSGMSLTAGDAIPPGGIGDSL